MATDKALNKLRKDVERLKLTKEAAVNDFINSNKRVDRDRVIKAQGKLEYITDLINSNVWD